MFSVLILVVFSFLCLLHSAVFVPAPLSFLWSLWQRQPRCLPALRILFPSKWSSLCFLTSQPFPALNFVGFMCHWTRPRRWKLARWKPAVLHYVFSHFHHTKNKICQKGQIWADFSDMVLNVKYQGIGTLGPEFGKWFAFFRFWHLLILAAYLLSCFFQFKFGVTGPFPISMQTRVMGLSFPTLLWMLSETKPLHSAGRSVLCCV